MVKVSSLGKHFVNEMSHKDMKTCVCQIKVQPVIKLHIELL